MGFQPLLARWRALSLQTFVPTAVIVTVGLWLTRTFWLPGRYVAGFDTFAYSGPNSEITTAAVRNGHLPLINDTIFGGVTHFGNPQTGVLYLPRLLPLIMDTHRAMGVLVVVHVLLLGLGMRHLLRRLSLDELSSTVGALALMASGAVMTKTVQFEQILVLAWLPWLLVAIHSVTIERMHPTGTPSLRSIGVLSLVTAAVCSAGHPQLTYQLAVTALIFWLALLWQARTRKTSRDRLLAAATAVLGGVGLGILMVLPQMWAALEATQNSALSGGRDISALGTSDLALTVHRSARAILGTLRPVDPGMFVGSFEPTAYMGVVLVLLAVIGVVSAVRTPAQRSWALACAALALGAFIVSLGPRTLVFRAAFRLVPGFDFARVSARWLVIATFAVCVLAAVGLNALTSRIDRRTVYATLCAVILGSAYVLTTTTWPDAFTGISWSVTAVVVVVVLVLAKSLRRPRTAMIALASLTLAELLIGSTSSFPQQGRADAPFTHAHSPLTDWLAAQDGYTIALTRDFGPVADVVIGLRPNTNTLNGIRSIDGYDGGVQITHRWATALDRFTPSPIIDFPLRNNLLPPIDTRVAARTGIHHLVVDRSRFDASVAQGWEGPIRSEGVLDVYRNPSWRGEALSWPAARTLPRDDINDALRTDTDAVVDVALVETELKLVRDSCDALCPMRVWSAERERPERIVITGTTDVASLVTYPVQFGPGWKATVDGRSTPIVALDALYLGVEVPAGRHTIVFEYRPQWILPTFLIAGLAAISVIILLVGRVGHRHRRALSDADGTDSGDSDIGVSPTI